MCFATSHMCASAATAILEVGVFGESEPELADVDILSETDVYSTALHRRRRGLHFEEQLHYHYQLIN